MTKKKEEREYAKNREEYFREFHRVIAPVVVLKVEGKDDLIFGNTINISWMYSTSD